MKYGYCRVSSESQNLDRQTYAMHEVGVTDDNMYMDKMSGKDFNRTEYQKLMGILQEGDILYVLSIDRLGRNYEEIIEQWHHITKEIKADIVVMDMPLLDTTAKNHDLTGRFVADLVLQILSYVAQKERESIKRRQAEGIAIAKAAGKYRRCNATDEDFRRLKKVVDSGKMTVTAACKELGITRRTWYLRMKEI